MLIRRLRGSAGFSEFTGCESATPSIRENRELSTPIELRYCRVESARFADRLQLLLPAEFLN